MAQNSVSIGTEEINENAVLQLVSPGNNQGFLVPRLTSLQRTSMQLDADDDGMLVFDTDESALFYWRGGKWYQIITGGDIDTPNLSDVLSTGNDADGQEIINLSDPMNNQDAATKNYVDNMVESTFDNSWKTSGNAGTDTASNFIGTTDNQDLIIRTNSSERVRIESTDGTVTVSNNLISNNNIKLEANFYIMEHAQDMYRIVRVL